MSVASRSVSVVLPVYNGEDYLVDAVLSLLRQPEALEVIVSDDNSTDETLRRLRSVKDEPLRIITNSGSRGQFSNFNHALMHARGELIQLFSHDDIAKEGFLASQIATLKRYPRARLVYSGAVPLNEAGIEQPIKNSDDTPECIDHATYVKISAIHGALPPSISCIMIYRELLDHIGYFDTSFQVAGDLEFVNRAAAQGPIVRNTKKLVQIRQHTKSVTSHTDTPLHFMSEEARLMPYYRLHLSQEAYLRCMRLRERTRGADHAKFIIRAMVRGDFTIARRGLQRLSKVHNVWRCMGHACLQRAGLAHRL